MTIFAFADPNDTETSQPAADATNKCDLEVLQFIEDNRKDVLNSYPVVKKLFVQHDAVLPSWAPVERLFSFAGIHTSSSPIFVG